METFETAVRFQMHHALALLATGVLTDRWKSRLFSLGGALFTAGEEAAGPVAHVTATYAIPPNAGG